MAIIYGDGKAGQHAKRTAAQYLTQYMYWCLGGGIVGGVVLGVIIAVQLARFGLYHWSADNVWTLVIIEAVITVLVLYSFRRIDAYTAKLARERIKWLRGAQGEALVAWYLNDLPNSWYVFHNVEVPSRGDLDHVLIGPPGIFCLSTKSNRGLYSAGPNGTYLLNGKDTDHVAESQKLALRLKDLVEHTAGPLRWVQPVLIAPFAFIEFDTFYGNVWVLNESNLNDVFLNAPAKLKSAEVDRLAKAFRQLVYRPAEA